MQYPHREQACVEVRAPRSLEELRAELRVREGQSLLVAHPRHPQQQFLVETLDQVFDGAALRVTVPRRRIFISVRSSNQPERTVMWYHGSTADEIEQAIVKAAGLTVGTPIELLDGDASVAISTTIPNDTRLEVVPFLEFSPPAPSMGNSSSSHGPQTHALGHKDNASIGSPSVNGQRDRSALRSPSTRSVGSRSGTPLKRAPSPARSRAQAPPATTVPPAGRSSAPEEHCVHILAGHAGFVLCLCSVGDILFTGSQDSNIMIWDLNNLQYIGTLPGHKGFVKCMCASYQRKMLCSGSQDRTVKVWSLDSFSCVKTLVGHTGDVNTLCMVDALDVLVSGSEDRSICVWSISAFTRIACLEQVHAAGIFALERLDDSMVLSGSRDRSIKVWNTNSWQVNRTLGPPHYDCVTGLAVSGKRGKFYSCSRDKSIKEWDSLSGRFENTLHSVHVHGDWLMCLAMSSGEDILFSGSKDNTVKVWDNALQCRDILVGHRGAVSSLLCVNDHLFSASYDRTVRVWKVDQYYN